MLRLELEYLRDSLAIFLLLDSLEPSGFTEEAHSLIPEVVFPPNF